ncbi:PE-PPE domain-containing protein [Mycolicibacterium porcinum]|nr:PE-PPE domain-containing protein [Mycolicibacterium porcinum]
MTGRGQRKGSSRTARRQRGASRWAPVLLAGGVAAASVSVTAGTPTATHSAAVRLTGTTIGVGASYDAFGLSIPAFFYGTVIREGDSYRVVPYPAQISVSIPIISDLPGLSDLPYWTQSLTRSEAIGAGYLLQDIAGIPAGEKVTIIGVSQGTQVAEIARTEMAKLPNYVANAQNYEFVLLGDPYQPNGGILSRFTQWSDVPLLGDTFPFGRPGPSDSPFKTTYYQNQYDGVADFPAYFNVLSVANAVAGMAFGHAFPGYVAEYPDAPNAVTTQVGNTTYVTLPQYLPLLAPLRIPASPIGAERFVDAIDPVLRVFVEMGYDRTADPSRVKQISWTVPEEKVTEALNELPGAFKQSVAILGGEKYTPTLPQPVVSDAEPDPPLPEHPADPVGTSPFEQGLRRTMDDMAAALSNATRPLAKVFQAIGGRTPDGNVTDAAEAADATEVAPVYRLNRSARTQSDSPRSGPAQRLKNLRKEKQSGREHVRSVVNSAKQAAKTAHAQRQDPPKRKSKRAG